MKGGAAASGASEGAHPAAVHAAMDTGAEKSPQGWFSMLMPTGRTASTSAAAPAASHSRAEMREVSFSGNGPCESLQFSRR